MTFPLQLPAADGFCNISEAVAVRDPLAHGFTRGRQCLVTMPRYLLASPPFPTLHGATSVGSQWEVSMPRFLLRVVSYRSVLGVLALSTSVAAAEGTLEGIDVLVDPPLPIATLGERGESFTAEGGDTVRLTVIARYSDGTTVDVTNAAQFTALSSYAHVTSSGLVTLATPPRDGPIGVDVSYGGKRHIVAFSISP